MRRPGPARTGTGARTGRAEGVSAPPSTGRTDPETPPRPRIRARWLVATLSCAVAVGAAVAGPGPSLLASARAEQTGIRVSSARLGVQFGDDGSVQSLQVTHDAFPTEYVMNPSNAPEQAAEPDAELRQWFGNVMFSYVPGTGKVTQAGVGGQAWQRAWTTASSDARTVTHSPNGVEVAYAGSKAKDGIKDFRLTERFSFDTDGSLIWRQTVTNTSRRPLTIGDWGVPVPGNELWKGGDKIYETRVLTRSSITADGSYLRLGRPSGLGPSILMLPDPGTGSPGWEYQDRWRTEEVGPTTWAWNADQESSNIKGLNVYYFHSAAISSTHRGYLPSTSLALAPGTSRTYAIRVTTVDGDSAVPQALYDAGMPDVAVAPGMVVPYDQAARIAVRVKGTITSVTARPGNDLGAARPTPPVVSSDGSAAGYQRYRIKFSRTHLGTNQVRIGYHDQWGSTRTAVMQYRVVDKVADLMSRHAGFIVDKQQWTAADGLKPTDVRYGTFDDWMMNTPDGGVPSGDTKPQGRRNEFDGYWGLGDDWGLTHAEFLAAQQVLDPQPRRVEALDTYLEYAVWRNLMGNVPGARVSYLVPDFWDAKNPGRANSTPTGRGYAYPHVYNTFLSMYQIAEQNPGLIRYAHPARWYLETAYRILVELYDGNVSYNWSTGLMGEQTTPALVDALRAEGMDAEADGVLDRMAIKFANFGANAYPYGSEYAYDNTGEEAVYTLARMVAQQNGSAKAIDMMHKIVTKTTAARGHNPVWFQYADPVTNTGENWWQFQYTIALAGRSMDDYLTTVAPMATGADALTPGRRAELQRLNYGAKLGGLSLVNSGEISAHPANIGASAWTYQAEKGNLGTNGVGGGPSVTPLNGYRGMTGESDLTLWGILQYLSADVVTDDPIFGTIGYGANVHLDGSTVKVVPTDGLSRRLNLVSQGLSVALTSDRYRTATVPTDGRGLTLGMVNTGGRRHATTIQVTGLAEGSYAILVDGHRQGTVNAYHDGPQAIARRADVAVTVPAGAGSTVELRPVSAGPDAAPTVTALADRSSVVLGVDRIALHATADDDGLGAPNGRLATRWTSVSAPAGAKVVFSDETSTHPMATVDTAGTYTFRFTADDGALVSHTDVTVTAAADHPGPNPLLEYTFDSAPGTSVPDASGHGMPLKLDGAAEVVRDPRGGGYLQLGDSITTWVQLPPDVLAHSGPLTVSMWVRPKVLPKDLVPLLSFGRDQNRFLDILAAEPENGLVALETSDPDNPTSEPSVNASSTLPVGSWTHLRFTLEPNSGKGMTGRIYANGTLVGQGRLPLAAGELGRTTRNLVGRTYGGTRFVGDIDDLRVDGGAVDTYPGAGEHLSTAPPG